MNPFQKQPEKFWRGVGIAPIRLEKPRIQLVGPVPISEPDIFIDVVGLRSDGCEFTIAVGVDSEHLGACKPADVLLGIHQQLMMAFGSLQSYRDCECHYEFVCKVHTPPVPN